MDKAPLLVFLSAAPVERQNFCDSFSCEPPDLRSWVPVGTIDGYDALDLNDMKIAERDLGAKLHVGTVSLTDKPGYGAALVAVGIFVDSYESAKALPGFKPTWMMTGYIYLPPKITRPKDPISRHKFNGDALPEYIGGVFVQSMIPQGEIAAYVYFEDDPLHIYLVHGYISTAPDMLARVREWRAENKF